MAQKVQIFQIHKMNHFREDYDIVVIILYLLKFCDLKPFHHSRVNTAYGNWNWPGSKETKIAYSVTQFSSRTSMRAKQILLSFQSKLQQ